jgi:hypothetical protein
LKLGHFGCARGYLHVVNGKGGKHRTAVLPKPVLVALEAHLKGRNGGSGRDMAISTRQIQRLLDGVAADKDSR